MTYEGKLLAGMCGFINWDFFLALVCTHTSNVEPMTGFLKVRLSTEAEVKVLKRLENF